MESLNKFLSTKLKYVLILFTILLCTSFAHRALDPIEHTWANQENTGHIQIYKATDGKFYGKLVWVSEPIDEETKKPKLDKMNPDATLKSKPVLNLVMIKGYEKNNSNPNLYEHGTIYDPKNGKTYCGKMTLEGKKMKLRGFICGLSLLGRSETWTIIN